MTDKICERKIFISSTIRNLKDERIAIQERLQRPFGCIKFHAVSSDRPETLHLSGDDLETYAGYNPNLFILNQVKYVDYYLLILNDDYYGEVNIRDLGSAKKEIISVTHAEFRAAFRQAQPIFAFIERSTYRRYFWTLGGRIFKNWIRDRDVHVYKLIHEIRKYRKGLNMTIATYSSIKDLINEMERIFTTYDKSKYVFSEFDEEVCKCGDEITAVWEVVNQGCVVWRNRFFKEQNTSLKRFIRESAKALIKSKKDICVWNRFITFIRKWFQYIGILVRGRKSIAESSCYPIEVTYPGERARLTVKYIVPDVTGEIVSSWIMVDATGRKIYRNLVPLEAEYFIEGTYNERKNIFSKLRRKCAGRTNS